ncbi:hypothetical protein DU976_17260 [Vibrio navarrensis]|nr:hypothetical protein [Vibrio navarrensis]
MSFQQIMQSAGRAQFNALGDFLFVEKSPGLVLITTATGGYYELTQGAQIKGDRVSGLITVENKGEAGEIRIKTGFGEYVPPQRETVAVSAMPALEIAAGQSVNVGAMPALQIAAGQSVNVGAMPALQIAAGQSVNVGAMPALQIAAGQSVNVEAMPALEIAAGQSVNVEAMPALQIAAGQSVAVAVSGSLNASVQVMPYTLPANPERKSVKIKAAVDNAGLVTLAGVWPLAAGETIELETTAEIVLTGAATESAIILEN